MNKKNPENHYFVWVEADKNRGSNFTHVLVINKKSDKAIDIPTTDLDMAIMIVKTVNFSDDFSKIKYFSLG